MEHINRISTPEAATAYPVGAIPAPTSTVTGANRVLRNTYALLAMTLLFSAAVAAVADCVRDALGGFLHKRPPGRLRAVGGG